MTPENDKALRAAYPLVFPKPLLNDEPIRCGDGWLYLLHMLCRDMTWVLEKLPPRMQARLCAVQVKEKLGTLRFYLEDNDPTSPVAGFIRAAEWCSGIFCDVCGKPGSMRTASSSDAYPWMRTRCDAHVDWRPSKDGLVHAAPQTRQCDECLMTTVFDAPGLNHEVWCSEVGGRGKLATEKTTQCNHPEGRRDNNRCLDCGKPLPEGET
jgi:hypothetical protein